jgi:transcriptional regulator with XRE-family HTH domain
VAKVFFGRAKAGLTQRQLAEKAGVPYSTIAKIESGNRQPTHPTMAKILAAVDLSLSTRLMPYDEHDDVLWEQERRRSPRSERALQLNRRDWRGRRSERVEPLGDRGGAVAP